MERLTGKELRRLSEFLRDLYQLRTHEEFSDHVITALPAVTEGEFTSYMAVKAGSDLTITVSRHQEKREFREPNRTIFNVLRPHLKQALENALAVTQMQNQLTAMNQVMEEGQQALISVTENGRIRFVTPYAQKLLQQYGLQARTGLDQLPSQLRDWLAHYHRQLDRSDDVPPELDPLLIQGELGGLSIRLIVRGSQYLLILEERRAAPAAKDLASFGLSTRESEILDWVAQGKTNPEVGMILGISRRTIQKHLERIYIKLGVESRTAASAMVAGIAQLTDRS